MTAKPTNHPAPAPAAQPKWKPWAWFIGLWLAGFLTLGAISMTIKAIMNIG